MGRCKVKLKQINKESIKLKYMHELMQGMIYQIPSQETSRQLHEKGIRSLIDERRLFKEIAFSTLRAPQYEILNKGREIRFNDNVFFYLASPNETILKELLEEIVFSPKIRIGNAFFIPLNNTNGDLLENSLVEIDKGIFKEGSTFLEGVTITPIIISDSFIDSNNRQKVRHYSPNDIEFYKKITNNLKNKFSAYYKTTDLSNFCFNIKFHNHKLKGINYKRTLFIGTEGNFRIETNYETAKVINDFGLGVKNAQGFGQIIF